VEYIVGEEHIMKFIHVSIMAIMLVVIAVAIAGCTSTSPSSSTSTQTSGSSSSVATPSGAASSSSQQVGSTVSSSSVFGTNYNWVGYQITSNYGGTERTTTTKIERSTGDYKGTPAIHQKMTSTISTGTSMVYDVYYDTAMSNVLGGTMTTTVNGQTMTQDVPASQLSTQVMSNFNKESPLTFAGIEPVSVPAGTYPVATKYTKSFNETEITYWAVSGIPVPVKEMTSSSQGSSTLELTGWG
jgi:hypothetical protein